VEGAIDQPSALRTLLEGCCPPGCTVVLDLRPLALPGAMPGDDLRLPPGPHRYHVIAATPVAAALLTDHRVQLHLSAHSAWQAWVLLG